MTATHRAHRVNFHCDTNNFAHHTNEISVKELIVRRGQPFKLTLADFSPTTDSLSFKAATGERPTEEQGTLSFFSLPESVGSRRAKAAWRAELQRGASTPTVLITPPADCPVGEFNLFEKRGGEYSPLGKLVVLYNPWCPDDWVYMSDVREIHEYVMNEQGVLFRGSADYIFPLDWDFGQFEENMVEISLKILDLNRKHFLDPANDVSARCNPIYVGRVVSAMINSQDDNGVVMGRWDNAYEDGVRPGHWTGSHAILKRWFDNYSRPVKYGQCWVFAGVMCSVMRLLGVPCRVVSNFQSAHDNNKNLTIDVFHADYGVREIPSHDSIWNFHVWVEAWMRRPDLSEDGRYDGWQVLDPTPQEKSEGVYCCGPASLLSILNGETNLKYDIPFVFAEVNADCIVWLVKADGSKLKISTDTKSVGQNISTKAVGSENRKDITDTYKHREGSDKERSVFHYARTRDYSRVDVVIDDEDYDGANGETEEEDTVENIAVEEGEEGEETEDDDDDDDDDETSEGSHTGPPGLTPPEPVHMHFEEVTPPTNGKDVRLKLVLQSESTVYRWITVNIRVQAMRYNGAPGVLIQDKVMARTLQTGRDLSIPIRIPFSDYHAPMLHCDSIKVTVVATDKLMPDHVYLASDDIVLIDPPIAINVTKNGRLYRALQAEVVFKNPVNETLTSCSLTVSGSGLLRNEVKYDIPDLRKNNQIRVMFPIVPYKVGKKTLVADFDCATFRDIKGRCVINVRP